jgi:hypothetical protein
MLLLRTVRTVELKTGQSRQWDWGGFVFVRGWLQLQTCSSGRVYQQENARFQEAHQTPTFGPGSQEFPSITIRARLCRNPLWGHVGPIRPIARGVAHYYFPFHFIHSYLLVVLFFMLKRSILLLPFQIISHFDFFST